MLRASAVTLCDLAREFGDSARHPRIAHEPGAVENLPDLQDFQRSLVASRCGHRNSHDPPKDAGPEHGHEQGTVVRCDQHFVALPDARLLQPMEPSARPRVQACVGQKLRVFAG